MSALEDKQDLLVSGTNIKTVNGDSVLGSGNMTISAKEYTYNLSTLERQLKTQAISDINHVINDLIVGDKNNTEHLNKNDLFIFGVITDLHHITDGHSYGGTNAHVVTKSEHSIRLLGAIAYEVGLDTVICCGDYSNGYKNHPTDADASGYSRQEYDEIIMPLMSSMFSQYIPCPYFFVDGNHDRGYTIGDNFSTNKHWLETVDAMNNTMGANVTVKKIKDIIKDNNIYYPSDGGTGSGSTMVDDGVTGNGTSASYIVDFNTKKVRCALFSSYENYIGYNIGIDVNYGSSYPLSIYAATKFYPASDAQDWKLIAFRHSLSTNALTDSSIPAASQNAFFGILNSFMMEKDKMTGNYAGQGGYNWLAPNPNPNNNNKNFKGKALVGIITGHQHLHMMGYGSNTTCRAVIIANAFANSNSFVDGFPVSEDAYCFSLFVIDPINWWLYEVQVGRHDSANESLSEGSRERVARANGTTENITGIYRYKIVSHT